MEVVYKVEARIIRPQSLAGVLPELTHPVYMAWVIKHQTQPSESNKSAQRKETE